LLHRFYHDDAYIALRYAGNLLDGQGLVWNPGERVEGYTSLLWVIACAALGRTGIDLEVASRLLGLASLLGLLILVGRQARAGALACALIATTGPVVAWSLGGLETVGFAFLLTAAFLSVERLVPGCTAGAASDSPVGWTRCVLAGALFGVAELCRPEALLFFGLCAPVLVPGTPRSLRKWGGFAAFVCGFGAVFGPRLVWRLSYYGALLPNTFAAKIGSVPTDAASGFRYVANFLLSCPAFTLLALWALIASRRLRRTRCESAALIATGLYLSYVVWVGGDHMPWFRFLVPVLPIGALLIARRIESHDRGVSDLAPARALIVVLCALNFGSGIVLAKAHPWTEADPAARGGRVVGLFMRDRWPANAVVALNTAGSTPYFSRLRCIDMLGLNDRTIARRRTPAAATSLPAARMAGHHKGGGAYVLSRRPDYIILGGSEGYVYPWFVGDKELVDNPAFHELYALRRVEIPRREEPGRLVFEYFELKSHVSRASPDSADPARQRFFPFPN